MAVALLLAGFLLTAAITDLAEHKIYNWTTYSGTLFAWGLNSVGSAATAAGWIDQERLSAWGWIGLGPSLIGFAACGFVMLVAFVFFRVGGGDVKLIAMIGAIMGPERGITAMLWTFVLGGCLGLIVLVWRVGPWRLLTRTVRQILWTLRLGRWQPLSDEERAQLQPPLFLAPCALAAVAMVESGWM